MKKIPIKMVLGYVIISFLVLWVYDEGVTETKIIESWNDEADETFEMVSVTKVLVQDEKNELSMMITNVPEITQECAITPYVTKAPSPTVTTIMPTPIVAEEEIPKEEIHEEIELPKDLENNKSEVIQYNSKKIKYENTTYRMTEQRLKEVVDLICGESYSSSFVLYDVNSDAMICYNEKEYYPVASTVKAPFVMTCLQQIEEGAYSFDDKIKYTEEYMWSGDGIIQQGALGDEYTLKEIIEYTIKVSDDVGYMMLLGCFGTDRYNQFLEGLGNLVTIGGSVKWGNTSAIDSLRNWKQIYRYIDSGSENALFFADLLKQTNKSCIRNALGGEFEILNKMGWGVRNKCCHDHAIVMGEYPYMIIIMTMGDAGGENQQFIEKMAVILSEIHEEMISQEVE